MIFLNPQQIINNLSFLDPHMVACDIGSGSGGWTIPLAKKLDNGKVYAVDIKEEALSALRSKLDSEKVFNVELLLADIEKGVKITDNTIDFIILSNVLFEIEDKKKVLEESKRILRNKGHLLVVDWKKSDRLGAQNKAVLRENIIDIASQLNLKLKEEFESGNYHFALVFENE
jgi:ubiquinone/menaquinone biosynthesis C-methylase UbiE